MPRSVIDYILSGLMRRYQERVPDVGSIIEHMIDAGLIQTPTDIENDHIAFRTLKVPHLGIGSLEKIFLHHGFIRRDAYQFPVKKLNAFWYAPPSSELPRIFVSELRVDELSPEAQTIIRTYTNTIQSDPVDQLDLNDGPAIDSFLHQSLWPTPTWSEYEFLSRESEYAAWAIYNRYYLNHFTISVQNLPSPLNKVSEFNCFLEKSGFRLNDSGGTAKTSNDGLLIQSSTVAEMVEVEFPDGRGDFVRKTIPGSYVEFAERRVLPQFADLPPDQITGKHRRDGFEANNADKIFESTYLNQTQKKN